MPTLTSVRTFTLTLSEREAAFLYDMLVVAEQAGGFPETGERFPLMRTLIDDLQAALWPDREPARRINPTPEETT